MKKKTLITMISVVLVLALAIGGTLAYLQDQTEDLVNHFKDNKVTVDLSEASGQDYNIVPGTSQDKNPKVSGTTTLPAYVYVLVTDDTKGRVDYEIADGWSELSVTGLESNQTLYYREVAAEDSPYSFSVLKGDKVNYPSTLKNAESLDEKALTFKAFAIQKETFADAAAAWKNFMPDEVGTSEELADALAHGQSVTLTQDLALTQAVEVTEDIVIDVAGKDLSVGTSSADGLVIKDGATVTLTDSVGTGSFTFAGTDPTSDVIYVVNSDPDTVTTLNIENITIDAVTASKIMIHPYAEAGKAVINILDGTVINVEGDGDIAGIFVDQGGEVNMKGGVINVNGTGGAYNNAIGIGLGKVNGSLADGVVNMSGGEINVEGTSWSCGIQTDMNGTINMTGGVINVKGSGNTDSIGLGTYSAGTINMTGGVINVGATSGYGYGICLYPYGSGTATVSGDAQIIVDVAAGGNNVARDPD